MSTTQTFHIRGLDEGLGDGQFLIDSFNATLPHLASIGSGGQWGSKEFSERANAEDRMKLVKQAARYQATGEGDPILVFVLEAEIPSSAIDELPHAVKVRTDETGKKLLPVGSVMLSQGLYPHYMGLFFHQDPIKKELDGTREYVYCEALITDFRTGPWRKGAGAALLEHARRFCKEKGKPILYVDCYAGNDGKLIRYYENQGFTLVDHFEAPDESKWPGAFLRADIPL
ncbi:acetyltransferase [Xylaria sp. FL0064]|nr:acetyltransferase [Xylaria sp. FL0064]